MTKLVDRKRENFSRLLRIESLEHRVVMDGSGLLHTIPFSISGAGEAPEGLPLLVGESAPHNAAGNATRLGSYDGEGALEFLGFTGPTTGQFKSSVPFVFEDFNRINGGGDKLAFDYGDTGAGADEAGEFTILPQADGKIVVEFVAEFTLDTEASTGRFKKYSEGSFVMIATTQPFAPPMPGEESTVPFEYSWVGEGTLSFPMGDVYEVTTLADSGEGSLRAAVEMANADEGIATIAFDEKLRGKIPLLSQLDITDDVTIIGNGKRLAISGQEATRVFSVNPFADGGDFERIAFELQNITVADGLATDAPGLPPIFAFGGGVYNLGGDVSLEGVRFLRNQVGDGSVFVSAGGAVANEFGGTLTVNNSVFEDNVALGVWIGAGGAIAADVGPTADGVGTKSPITLVNDSQFSNNHAEAIETDPAAAGAFAPFAGFAFGGAVSALAGEFQSVDSRFRSNSVRSGDGVNGNFSGNANGGAIFVTDFSPFIASGVPGRDSFNRVVDSHFERNSAKAGSGDGSGQGGFANGGAVAANISFFPNTLEIVDSNFVRNEAVGGGGGRSGGDGGLGAGGALAGLGGASVLVVDSRFSFNEAVGGSGNGAGKGGTGLGGALGFATAKTSVPTPLEGLLPSFVVQDSRFTFNRAEGGRGGRNGDGGDGNGGAIGVQSALESSVSGSTLFGNRAVGGSAGGSRAQGGNGQGGGIYNDAAVLSLTSSVTRLNRAIGGSGGRHRDRGDGLGGGFFNSKKGTFNIDADSVDATFLNWSSDFRYNNFFGDFNEV